MRGWGRNMKRRESRRLLLGLAGKGVSTGSAIIVISILPVSLDRTRLVLHCVVRPSSGLSPSLRRTALSTGFNSMLSSGLTKYRTPRRSMFAWSGGGATTRWIEDFKKPFVMNSRLEGAISLCLKLAFQETILLITTYLSAKFTVMEPGNGLTHRHDPSLPRT